MDFKAFPSIERFEKVDVEVTQKLHGSNASVTIMRAPMDVLNGKHPELIPFLNVDTGWLVIPGKRTSYINLENDNFGFAKFISERKDEFVTCLGEGTFYGEWVGPGINSGEGLKEKLFVLFDTRLVGRPLPNRCFTVPVLWKGALKDMNLENIMHDLKVRGSQFVSGFMRPEGVVIRVQHSNIMWKEVFESETTQWRKSYQVDKPKLPEIDVSALLQPIRAGKLLSRDEVYLKEYPQSLPKLVSAYVADLIKENEISGDDDQVSATKKALGKRLFGFMKAQVEKYKNDQQIA